CQAWERSRHSVVRMASFLRGPGGAAGSAGAAATSPVPAAPRNVRREIMANILHRRARRAIVGLCMERLFPWPRCPALSQSNQPSSANLVMRYLIDGYNLAHAMSLV